MIKYWHNSSFFSKSTGLPACTYIPRNQQKWYSFAFKKFNITIQGFKGIFKINTLIKATRNNFNLKIETFLIKNSTCINILLQIKIFKQDQQSVNTKLMPQKKLNQKNVTKIKKNKNEKNSNLIKYYQLIHENNEILLLNKK